MILGGSLLGVSYFETTVMQPVPISFDKITFYGDCIIDTVHIRNIDLLNEEVDLINACVVPVWDNKTIMLANFTYNLGAGNITNLVNPITGWDVYRRITGDTTLKFIDSVDDEIVEINDYEAPSGKAYQHVIFPKTDTEIGEPIVTESIDAGFYGWYLIGQDNGGRYVYKFDMDVEFGGYQNDEDFTEYQTYKKYNVFSKGDRDFLRGSLKAYAASIECNGTTTQPVEYLSVMRTRINDNTTKILKSRKGEIWKVKTHAFSMTPINNNIKPQPYYIGFEFIECEEV